MTYYIAALTNDPGRNLVSKTSTTDAAIADMVAAELERRGFIVSRWQEG